MTIPERHLRIVADESQELRGRINVALSLVQHRHFCGECQRIADLIRMALAGASIDQLQEKDR